MEASQPVVPPKAPSRAEAFVKGVMSALGAASAFPVVVGAVFTFDCRIVAGADWEQAQNCYMIGLPVMGIGIGSKVAFGSGFNTPNPNLDGIRSALAGSSTARNVLNLGGEGDNKSNRKQDRQSERNRPGTQRDANGRFRRRVDQEDGDNA